MGSLRFLLRQVWLAGLLVAAFCSGCVSEQHSEFRGVFSRGTVVVPPTVGSLGGQFFHREQGIPNALIGFGLPEPGGNLVFICDREKLEQNSGRLSSDVVSAVYLTDWLLGDEALEKAFLGG